MKIRAILSGYPPVQGAGAEWYMHSVLRMLKLMGHEVSVVIVGKDADRYPIEYEGIPIDPLKAAIGNWPDVLFSHLGGLPQARRLAKRTKRPLVHFCNNAWSVTHCPEAALQVFNTQTVKDGARSDGVVVYPPVFPEDYTTTPGRSVTLINLMEAKGARIFYHLADAFPEIPFLGVVGGWGEQVYPDHEIPNLTIIENTPGMRAVYAQTSILLMPSDYESFGRVGLEAACSGILVLANDLAGINEALGDGAVYVDGLAPSRWEDALRHALAGTFDHVRPLAMMRSHHMESLSLEQMDDLEYRLSRLMRGINA